MPMRVTTTTTTRLLCGICPERWSWTLHPSGRSFPRNSSRDHAVVKYSGHSIQFPFAHLDFFFFGLNKMLTSHSWDSLLYEPSMPLFFSPLSHRIPLSLTLIPSPKNSTFFLTPPLTRFGIFICISWSNPTGHTHSLLHTTRFLVVCYPSTSCFICILYRRSVQITR